MGSGVKCNISKRSLNSVIIQSKKEGKDQESIHNQAPHLTQDINRKVTRSQLDITNESQEVSPFPAGDHKASTNRHA